MSLNKTFVANTIAVDYLKMTTFSDRDMGLLEDTFYAYLQNLGVTPRFRDMNIMQYEGVIEENTRAFLGKGYQGKGEDKQMHFMFDLPGYLSDSFVTELKLKNLLDRFSYPRVDIQKTVHKDRLEPFYGPIREFFIKILESKEWIGRLPVMQFRDGLSMGFGNRKSLKYRRIYCKGDNLEYVRFETEFHNRYSNQAIRGDLSSHYFTSWTNMPVWFSSDIIVGSGKATWVTEKSKDEETILWIKKNIEPCIVRLLRKLDEDTATKHLSSLKQLIYDIEKGVYSDRPI